MECFLGWEAYRCLLALGESRNLRRCGAAQPIGLLSCGQLSLKPRKVGNVEGLKFVKRNEQFFATRCQLRIPPALKFGNKLALARDTKRTGYDMALSLLQLLLQHGYVLPLG